MMGCLMVTGVLLVTLLFHPPAAQMESPDTDSADLEAVRFGEFCLKISDDSHWTTPEPEPRQTVANKEAAESTQLPMSSPSDDKEDINSTLQPAVNSSSVVANIMGIPPGPGQLGPVEREGCLCKTWQERATHRSLVRSIEYRFPAPEVCNSTEIIETLVDGRKMCVNTSLTSFIAPHYGLSTDPDWEGTTTPSPNTSAVSSSPTTQTEEPMRMTPPRESREEVFDHLLETGEIEQEPPAPPAPPAPPGPPAPPAPPGDLAPPGPPGSLGPKGASGVLELGLLHCKCHQVESRRIGKLISKVELYRPSPSCNVFEAIATLKRSDQNICLDITAPWVRRLLEKMQLQSDSPPGS
ncbi:hypothetical protein J4Q44_G00054090 [Coregonus suidteri]|uniref:Chemokine interleukin-8-like domain-containing protein n=1 Tax=Coregonus suidteri TaxID=861788 RepID=A0AAN8M1R3_9TELE